MRFFNTFALVSSGWYINLKNIFYNIVVKRINKRIKYVFFFFFVNFFVIFKYLEIKIWVKNNFKEKWKDYIMEIIWF